MNEVYDAYTIRDEIGFLADSDVTDKKYLPVIKAAINEFCETSDKGFQIFVASLEAVNQFNVDTSELIWPVDQSRDFSQNEEIPLNAIVNKELWVKVKEYWEIKDPISWTAFIWRIAVPLSNKLNIVGSWRFIDE